MTDQELKLRILDWIGEHISWDEDMEDIGDQIVPLAKKLFLFVMGEE